MTRRGGQAAPVLLANPERTEKKMLEKINYKNGKTLTAKGRNGFVKQVGLEIMKAGEVITLFPVSTRGACNSCMLEIPTDPETLSAVINALNQAMGVDRPQTKPESAAVVTVIYPAKAEKLVEELKSFTKEDLAKKGAREILPYWYAIYYLAPGLHSDDESGWGEYKLLLYRVWELRDEGAFLDKLFYPLDVQKAGLQEEKIVCLDLLCEHCRACFIDDATSTMVHSGNGDVIQICKTCGKHH